VFLSVRNFEFIYGGLRPHSLFPSHLAPPESRMESSDDDATRNTVNLNSRWKTVGLACLVAALCYLAARLGGTLEILPQADWPLWPGNVLLASILLLVSRRIWPILMAAGFAAFVFFNLQYGMSIRSIILLLLSDSVEILTVALGLRYSFHGVPELNNVKSLGRYSFFAAFLAPAAGAIFGALATRGNYWTSWRISFFSEAIAYLTIMPAILGWVRQARTSTRAYYLEVALLMATIISLSYFVFVARWESPPALFFFLVPFLLWSALRFGSTGAGTAATIVAFLSVWGAAHGRGPFTGTAINNVLWLQLFLLSTAVPFMVLAALVEGHKRDEKVLRESEQRFRLVADRAPVLIWMSGPDKLCTFFNQGWLKFTGRTLEQELGDGWASGVYSEDVQRCIEIYSASFDARVDFEMEYRLRRFDGDYRWVVDYGVPRFESDGNFCGYIGSCVDITERRSSAESLQALTGRLIHAQEEERARIARELHDDFSQRLALQCIDLDQLRRELSESDTKERARVVEMLKRAKEMSADLRSMSHQLHSSKLEFVGLSLAVNGLCKEISAKYEIDVHFRDNGIPLDIPKDVALCLFRVTQEALGNVVKHSGAKSARVELGSNEAGVSLRIVDEGRGFEIRGANSGGGIGLVGMTERLRLVAGRLSIRSELMRGTEILAEVPLSSSVNRLRVKTVAAAGMQS
jgi:PAS domain S-box-containing protein